METNTNYRSVIFNSKDNTIEEPSKDKFICDGLIAPTISELISKGYSTSECCSGHSDEIFVQHYVYEEKLKEGQTIKDFIFDKYLEGKQVRITYTKGNVIRYVFLYHQSRTYIFFSKLHSFNIEPPEGFEIIKNNNSNWTCVQKKHSLTRKDGTYKTPYELDQEIKKTNEQLYEWAKSLSLANDLREGRKI